MTGLKGKEKRQETLPSARGPPIEMQSGGGDGGLAALVWNPKQGGPLGRVVGAILGRLLGIQPCSKLN